MTIDELLEIKRAHKRLKADSDTLKCLATSPRFQNMTVADALAELADNDMLHESQLAWIEAGGSIGKD